MISNALREARKRKGLTQQQVAAMLGVTLRAYQYWEAGSRLPTVDKAAQLAQILGLDVGYLLYELAVRKGSTNTNRAQEGGVFSAEIPTGGCGY